MKAFFRSLFLGALLGASGFISACDSKSDVFPTVTSPQTGTLYGQALPAFAAASVTARSYSTGQEITVVPAANGDYYFKDITVGKWSINISPAPGYSWLSPMDGYAKAGRTEFIGTSIYEPNITPGGWWSIDGKYHGFCIPLTNYQSNVLSFSYSSAGANMSIVLSGIDNSPMAFPLGSANGSSSITFSLTSPQGVVQQWTTVGGSGTVSVSVYGTNPRRVSGSFTCQAVPANSATVAPKQITGIFKNVDIY
ncbi:carboxypeptidase-like regulatory domain-containing protein [Hymenobacter glaciei]|uniref:carboxypeptidase-like regulatory domain-containing protein n=1 Tax=Hymenobacter glaciei TaxID=877209 RepID=UPI0031E7C6EE